jgi:hypothetical protein
MNEQTETGTGLGPIDAVSATWEAGDSPTVAIAALVASLTGRTQRDLPPLGECTDPDAIDVVLTTGEDVTITFDYCGIEIRADSAGTIRATGPGE